MVIGFVQGYEELKWGISKLNPLCNGIHLTFVLGVETKTDWSYTHDSHLTMGVESSTLSVLFQWSSSSVVKEL